MKVIIVIFTVLLSLCSQSQTNFPKSNFPLRFGIDYKVSTGVFYGHHLGLCINKNKHNLDIGAIFLPPDNEDPLKKRWDVGSYLNYDFYPFGIKHTLSFSLNTSLNYLYYRTENYSQNYLFHFIGPGLNTKITQNLHFKADLGLYTAYYSNSKYGIGVKYNDFKYFSLDDLLLRFSMKYYFNKK